ncbi:uncharacterized protein F5147DRAFT_773760 [Suillus discolor]|uniref:Uncharacterized protein n=1 Tax=Suillus discolor TaxID=1912936 RepID=A0A9P7F771_9AGAM|nr:uncharacterized protein F5147DRAFT_773760 [Suillus discolor]KAG2108177.1 hypothetical protein F5147DRAFT_773760 [Suillus discolor]
MSHDSCALNSDGSLKDASDIIFYNDPDDHAPLPQVPPLTSTQSTVPASTSTQSTAKNVFSALFKSGHTPPSAHVQDADNASSSSSTVVRKHALSSTADPPPPKKATMCILSPLDSDDENEGNNGGGYTHFSIQHYLVLRAIIHQFRARNALAPATFSALQLLKAGYRNGHVSAATEAEEFAAMLD